MHELEPFLVGPDDAIRQVISCIDRNAKGIALVVDAERRLLGTITDGDIRRAILAGLNLDGPASVLLARKAASPYPTPISAPIATDPNALLGLMQARSVRQLPLLDDAGRVVKLVTLDELVPPPMPKMRALIMAGGAGMRLRPLTQDMPKPMLPVGDRPLMELTVERLRHAGIRRVNVATHYQPEKIVEHFGDGGAFGVEINYLAEDQPLGTAGALGLLDKSDEPLLVINGDILTRVDFRAMLAYHRKHAADLTVAVRQYSLEVPYGTIECDGVYVRGVVEKPVIQFLVNAGIYLLEPSALNYVPAGQRTDMTDLIQRLLDDNRRIASFPIMEYWLDIGRHADYLQAQEDLKNERWTP
jgi:dTDP-glucose pyrophosphorylase/CBS domain-containing protein